LFLPLVTVYSQGIEINYLSAIDIDLMYRSPAGSKEQTNRDIAIFLIVDKLKSHVMIGKPILLDAFYSIRNKKKYSQATRKIQRINGK
jgi:hypothetical protein